MSIATKQERFTIAGDFVREGLNLLNAPGYSIIASTEPTEPDPQTFQSGVQQVAHITFASYSSTGQDDYLLLTGQDDSEWAVAIDKLVAQEVQRISLPSVASLNSGDFVVLESVDGTSYAVSIDKALAAEVATITPATKAGTTSGDYVAIYSEDGLSTYGISLDKSLAAGQDRIAVASYSSIGNDDWVKISAQDGTVYGVAFDKTLAAQTVQLTFPSEASLGNNDYIVLYQEYNGVGSSYAVNMDKSLKPQIDQLTFLSEASTGNDDWVKIVSHDNTTYAVALDKSASVQNFDLNFANFAGTADGDYVILTTAASVTWAIALDKVGDYGSDTILFAAKIACTASDFLYFSCPDGSHYALYTDLTGSSPAPSSSLYTSIPGSNKAGVNISGATTPSDVCALFVAAMNSFVNISSFLIVVDSGLGVMTVTQAIVGASTTAVSYDSPATSPGSGSTAAVTIVVAGVAQTIPTAAAYLAVNSIRKVVVPIKGTTTATSVALQVSTYIASHLPSIPWTAFPTAGVLNFQASAIGPVADPVAHDSPGTGAASFTITYTSHGTSVGAPSGTLWTAISGASKVVVNILNLNTAAAIGAATLTALNTISGFSGKITVSNPLTDGTLLLTQVVPGTVSTIPVPHNNAENAAGTIVSGSIVVGAATTFPAGAIWAGSFDAKITVECYGLNTASAIGTAFANAMTGPLAVIASVIDFSNSVVDITNNDSGAITGTPATHNSTDSGSGAVALSIIEAGADSSEPSGAIWTALASNKKSVVIMTIGQTAAQVATAGVNALNAIGGFSGRITASAAAGDGTFLVTQQVEGAVNVPVPYNKTEGGPGVITNTVVVAGSNVVLPSGAIWASISGGNKVTVDIRSLTTAAQIATAMVAAGASMMSAKITLVDSTGFATATQLVKGPCANVTTHNAADGGNGSMTAAIVTSGAAATVPVASTWTGIGSSSKTIVDGTVLTTAIQVAGAVYSAFIAFNSPAINTKLSLVNNANGNITITNVVLGDAPSPTVSTYNGSGSSSITFSIITPGALPSTPSGLVWSGVPSLQRVSAACVGLTSASQIAGAALAALNSLDGFSDIMTLANLGSGVMGVTQVVDGLVDSPESFNADDSGVGSITHSVTVPGIAGDVNVAESKVTIVDHGFATGLAVVVTGGTPPAPLVVDTVYYIIALDADTIQFATTYANAIAGTFIVFEDGGQLNTTFTITAQAFSVKIRVQGSNDGVIYADIVNSEKTLTEDNVNYSWVYSPAPYQYTRIAGTISGGQVTVDYFINAR